MKTFTCRHVGDDGWRVVRVDLAYASPEDAAIAFAEAESASNGEPMLEQHVEVLTAKGIETFRVVGEPDIVYRAYEM